MSCPELQLCLTASSCDYPKDFLENMHTGWRALLGSVICGVALIVYGWQFVRRRWTPCSAYTRNRFQKGAAITPDCQETVEEIVRSNGEVVGNKTEVDMLTRSQFVDTDGGLVEQLEPRITPFLQPGPAELPWKDRKIRYWASQSNFISSVDNVMHPPTSEDVREYTPQKINNGAFFGLVNIVILNYWSFKLIASTIVTSAGWACLATALATYYWLLQAHCGGCTTLLGADNITATLNTEVFDTCNRRDYGAKFGEVMSETYDDYKFFPIFLLVGYTGYLVNKFKDWMVNCHTIQARIHDIGVLVAGATTAPDEKDSRHGLFRVYRLLNLIHTVTYMDHTLELCRLSYEALQKIGLMTPVELKLIKPYIAKSSNGAPRTKNKVRDVAISWLSAVLMNLLKEGVLHGTYAEAISKQVAGLRGVTARHHDLFVRDNPNVYLSTMILTCDYLHIMIVSSMPFSTCIYIAGHQTPIQWVTWLCVFMMLSAFLLSHSLAYILRDPFLTKHDAAEVYHHTGMKLDDLIDCRALLHSTDCCLFAQLRANFDREALEAEETGAADSQLFQRTHSYNELDDAEMQINPMESKVLQRTVSYDELDTAERNLGLTRVGSNIEMQMNPAAMHIGDPAAMHIGVNGLMSNDVSNFGPAVAGVAGPSKVSSGSERSRGAHKLDGKVRAMSNSGKRMLNPLNPPPTTSSATEAQQRRNSIPVSQIPPLDHNAISETRRRSTASDTSDTIKISRGLSQYFE